MLAKLTAKNQLTLPKAILKEVAAAEYFVVSTEDGRIVLTPVELSRVDETWEKLRQLGITEQDVDDAVQWARRQQ